MSEFLCSDNCKDLCNQQHENSVVGKGGFPSHCTRLIKDQL